MARRALSIAFGFLGLAGAAGLYARTGDFPFANAVAVGMLVLCFLALMFSARRRGEALALDRLPDEEQHGSRAYRVTVSISVLAIAFAWAACGHAVIEGKLGAIEHSAEPITFAAIAGLLMFVSTYVLVMSVRALAVLFASGSFHEKLMEKIYGRQWRWIKNFRRLDEE
jgi:hypothetical protein